MTACKYSQRRGYTLIELLVVITIIAILAGLAFPVTNLVIRSARETKAANEIKNIETAVKAYHIDRSMSPLLPADQGGNIGWFPLGPTSVRGTAVLQALCGFPSAVPNPAETVYYEPPIVDNPRGGMTVDALGIPTGLYDPWGNPYFILIDSDYDTKLSPTAGSDGTGTIFASVLVASAGVGAEGPITYENLLTEGKRPLTSWK